MHTSDGQDVRDPTSNTLPEMIDVRELLYVDLEICVRTKAYPSACIA